MQRPAPLRPFDRPAAPAGESDGVAREAPAARPSRRSFLGALASGLSGLAAGCTLTAERAARVVGANDAVRIGVVGLHGRGKDHLAGFGKVQGVRVTALCDCDQDVLDAQLDASRRRGQEPLAFRDVRAMLESGAVDAVSIATPNHTHALLGIWAAQRGLAAYVEKPVSHDVWEGRQLAAAARQYGQVLAAGTQCRSHTANQEAIAYVRSGALGRVVLARGLCYKPRASIGKVGAPKAPPPNVDYDLWLGPAPEQQVRRETFHYDWHWQWPFGNGDLGNQGVHQVDLARWGLGVEDLPPYVLSIGARVGYDDDGETPNTQIVWCGYEPAPLLFEVRGLPARAGQKEMDQFLRARIGVVFHCEHGCVVLTSYEQGYACDLEGRVVREFRGGGDHYANFVAAVRAGDARLLTADVETGHRSAALCHLGNDSIRAGRAAAAGSIGERLRTQPVLHEAFLRLQDHLGRNGIAPGDAEVLTLGAVVRPAPDGSDAPRPAQREPFAVPSLA
jgi:predicted dehydrogenase